MKRIDLFDASAFIAISFGPLFVPSSLHLSILIQLKAHPQRKHFIVDTLDAAAL